MIQSIVKSRYAFWLILALPSIPMVAALTTGGPTPDGRAMSEALLHPTGEFAARFMIIAMALTPLRMLFPGSGLLVWLIRRRR